MYTGYFTDKNIEIPDNPFHISYAFFEDMVFVYFETKNGEDPLTVLADNVHIKLKDFPTGETWIRMTDIFHYSTPVSEEYWERKEKDKQIVFRASRLKYEEVSKYIYYHYKGQQTFAYRHEKYGAIYMYRNLLIIYDEFPVEKTDYSLFPDKWEDEDVLAEYQGDIITDLSLELSDGQNGWHNCER